MNLYQAIFAVFCFAFFVVAVTTKAPFAFLMAMLFAVLSRTAGKKGWWNEK